MEEQYLEHSREILISPKTLLKGGSKEVPLISLFGYQNEHNLSDGYFPIPTTKQMAFKAFAHEILWFMRGEHNIKYLVDNKVHIWTRDAFSYNLDSMVQEGVLPSGLVKYSSDWLKAVAEYEQRVKEDSEFAERFGSCGTGTYGMQWRHWKHVNKDGKVNEVDQLARFIETLKRKPKSKKNILSAWNPGEIAEGNVALEPCHMFFQSGSDGEVLDLLMYQRSCDMFLGVPANIEHYSLLTKIIAQEVGLTPRRFIHSFGDTHFYSGLGQRGEWYMNKDNFRKLQDMVRSVRNREDYLNVLEDLKRILPLEVDPEGNVLEGEKSYDHVTAIIEQLAREPREPPRLTIAKKPFNKLTIDDFKLEGYNPHPKIQRAMAV